MKKLHAFRQAIERDIDAGLYDGAAAIVARNGVTLFEVTAGYADRRKSRPLARDAIFPAFSVTKSFTAVAVLQCIEEGKLRLDTPVCEILPELSRPDHHRITGYQLLTQTAGMSKNFPELDIRDQGNLDLAFGVIADQSVREVPGETVSYSPVVAHAVLGQMLCRLDGERFRDIMARRIFRPLSMKDSRIGLGAEQVDRFAPVVVRDRSSGLFDADEVEAFGALIADPALEAEIPGAGAVTTIDDLMRFAEALRNGGVGENGRIASPAMVELMRRNHTGEMRNDLFNFAREWRDWPSFPANLGIGIALRGTGMHPSYFGHLTSPDTFGYMGLGSTLYWVDPVRQLTFTCMTTGLIEETASADRFQRLSDLAVAAADAT